MTWLHRFAKLVAACTWLLVIAGGLVTSTGSGLSVPDWPTTYGWSMFTFPLSKWAGGIIYEHGHRLIASTVGMLTILLVAWVWMKDTRPWVKALSVVALGAVITQGTLGGITVLFKLPPPISISHAGLAQAFFCMTVTIALATSRRWREGYAASSPASLAADLGLRRLAVITTAVIYLQILIGATIRHTGAGLAIPDFPLAFGSLLPPWDKLATGPVAVHFAHRLVALAAAALIFVEAARISRYHHASPQLTRPAWLLAGLVVLQIALGGLVVLSGRNIIVNTAHVANGALTLVTSLVVTLRAFRPLIDEDAAEAAAVARAAAGSAA
jgi:cytochrome c oxidase assembly protein subunit 15